MASKGAATHALDARIGETSVTSPHCDCGTLGSDGAGGPDGAGGFVGGLPPPRSLRMPPPLGLSGAVGSGALGVGAGASLVGVVGIEMD